MGKIVYEVTSGNFPITVILQGGELIGGAQQNIHNSFGTYEFDNIPYGIYSITFRDNTLGEVCENVEIINPCEECPPGFEPIGNKCQKLEVIPAIEHLPLHTLVTKQRVEYTNSGTLIFDDWNFDGVGNFDKISIGNPYWINQNPNNDINGPMNRSGVWANEYKDNQDISFSFCIDIAVAKTYYVGVGCDNLSSISLNGEKILKQDIGSLAAMLGITSNKERIPFIYWFIYPVYLLEGRNVLEISGHNTNSIAAVGIEIYDATKETLINVTSDIELGNALLFRSSDLEGQVINFENSPSWGIHGYECPPGFALVTCDGAAYCEKKEVIECYQTVAEIEEKEVVFDPDCEDIDFPDVADITLTIPYIMSNYFDPPRPNWQFEKIIVERAITSPNSRVMYNGSDIQDNQTISFSQDNAIKIITKNYLEEDTISYLQFKIKLVGEDLPTQELSYKFTNLACEETSLLTALYVSADITLSGSYNYDIEESITYDPGNTITFTNPITGGYHFLFVSIPTGREFKITGALDINLTHLFHEHSLDRRLGYVNNTLWRYEEPYAMNAPVEFKIILT